jgi:uncharacterized coiled-coil DUF342 family protein
MHPRRRIDDLLDHLTEEKEKLGKEKGKTKEILAEIKEIKDQIKELTHKGQRVSGLWTEMPEFTCKSIF